jgi:dihydroorotate dehydrogenase (NAD+) catalytic subunit
LKDDGLKTKLVGISLDNPTILAAGILGYSAETLEDIIKHGAGAVITKSVDLKPRAGYANPTIVQVECGILNAIGLPNPGINEFVHEIQRAKNIVSAPLIVSVFGFSPKEYGIVAKKAAVAGADAIELNVSCPHVEHTGSEIGQDPEILADVVSNVRRAVRVPIIVKLSPNVTDIVQIAKTAVKAGADALTAINTVGAMAIDVETTIPILSNKRGGLSGPAIKPIALRCVYDIYEKVRVPIIGCGGVTSWRDAVEFLLAGASAVQIGTAIASEGLSVFKSVNRGIEAYLMKKGFKNITQIVGLAHRKVVV